MGVMSTAEGRTNTRDQFGHSQRAVRFANAALGFKGNKPGTLDGQSADQQTKAWPALFDWLAVVTQPLTHGLAVMPGGVIPNQRQTALAACLSLITPPRTGRPSTTRNQTCSSPGARLGPRPHRP